MGNYLSAGGASRTMNTFSPGLMNPSSRRASSSMAAGSLLSLSTSWRSCSFSWRMRCRSIETAWCSRRALRTAGRPLAPTRAFTTSAEVATTRRMVTSRWPAGRRETEGRLVVSEDLVNAGRVPDSVEKYKRACSKVVSQFGAKYKHFIGRWCAGH